MGTERHAGLAVRHLRTAHKNLSRGGSLGIATADPDRLTGWVARNTERLVEALDYHQVYCDRLAMNLEFKDGGGTVVARKPFRRDGRFSHFTRGRQAVAGKSAGSRAEWFPTCT